MAVSKRASLGTGFGVIIALLVLSTALAYHIQESFSRRSVAIHRNYVHELETVASLRRLLYNAGISARDYLLNPASDKAGAYLRQLDEFRESSRPLLAKLRNSSLKPDAVRELEDHIQQLWSAMEHTATQQQQPAANVYEFVQSHIAPRRTAAGLILQELETANHSALAQTEGEFSESRAAAAKKLLWLLALCLLGGVGIAWSSLRYSDLLEREAAARFNEVLAAKLELERLSNRLMEIQEEERTRLSRELHDEIVQNVAVLKIEITQALSTLGAGPAKESLTRARQLAERTVAAVRNISLLLRPSLLDDLGLAPALQWLTEDFSKRTGVICEYTDENLTDDLPDAVNTCVYRVTQEALRNCEKHSGARHVAVRVEQKRTGLSVEIQDDGIGFQSESRLPGSLGVLGMRERAAALGGDLLIESVANKGATVRLWLPTANSKPKSTMQEIHAWTR